jgi:hypothetical protein
VLDKLDGVAADIANTTIEEVLFGVNTKAIIAATLGARAN